MHEPPPKIESTAGIGQERIPLQEVAYLECPLNLSIYQIDWQRYLWLS